MAAHILRGFILNEQDKRDRIAYAHQFIPRTLNFWQSVVYVDEIRLT